MNVSPITSVRSGLLGVLLCVALFPFPAIAEDAPHWEAGTLTGDWSGRRSMLADSGVTLEFTHRSDLVANMGGGLRRGDAWLGYTDARALLDFDKLHGWPGLTAYLHYHSALGDKPNARDSGSYMGVDNIETAVNTAQFFHAWVQQNFFEDSASVLLGLYPVDSEFYVTDTSGLFLHPSFGMAAEVAQTGVNGPPVYPMGALGMRVKYSSPERTAYLQLAVLDGVPGDPGNPYGTQVRLGKTDGSFAIAEIGYTPLEAGHTFEPVLPEGVAKMEPAIKLHEKLEGYDKTAFGLWRYSARFDDLTETDALGAPLRRVSAGWYALAERTLRAEEQDAAQGLAGFVRFGAVSADIHQSDWSASLGLRYMGLLDGRDEDVAGVATTISHASSKYRSLNQSAEFESVVEATYRIQLRPWLAVQPLLQYIASPNMDKRIPAASIVGTRIEIFI